MALLYSPAQWWSRHWQLGKTFATGTKSSVQEQEENYDEFGFVYMFERGGYRPWIGFPPPRGVLIELSRREWGQDTLICRREDVNLFFNLAGLFWRMSGIGKMEAK